MPVDSTGPYGQPHFDDSHSFDLAVDQNAVSDYAASILASLSTVSDPSAYLDLASGVAYDSTPGLNSVLTVGALHVVSLSLYTSTALTNGSILGTMKAGHRPAAPIFTGAVIIDNSGSASETGTAYIATNGVLGCATFTPDAGSDNKNNGFRGTFVFAATH